MNFYLTGIEGMPKLLECCQAPMPYFKKNVYSDAFKEMYQTHVVTFDAIEEGYNTVIDKEQFLTNMADALADFAVKRISGCSRKREQDRVFMDLNMAMAVFVLPMVLEYNGNSSKPLSEKLLAAWKREFPKSDLKAADRTYIEQGFHKKYCYITTAVCQVYGKSDDCYELTLLRDYRDTYLASLPEGESLIREYYDVAPSIVKHINQQEESQEIYRSIWDQYLNPCIRLIEQDRLPECRERYEDMVHTLRDKYFKYQSKTPLQATEYQACSAAEQQGL